MKNSNSLSSQKKVTKFPYFPLELWIKIASNSPEAWRLLTLAIPILGRWSLQPHIIIRMKKLFTKYTTRKDGWDRLIEEWKLPDGTYYRELDLPTCVYHYSLKNDGVDTISIKCWYTKHGDLYRIVDKPAEVWYRISGNILKEIWYSNGKKGRKTPKRNLPKPAVIHYDEREGLPKKFEEKWFVNGECYMRKCYSINGAYTVTLYDKVSRVWRNTRDHARRSDIRASRVLWL